ncbi:acidic repeat-containing protein [Pimephales promelas]|uniref:acidic repeat-containing protein n=1 Tax=Pimephales promelas TaxID=90988 RepID=UPI00195558E1|nr:acidic repeat-containing protein [Pimephales promelas]KAG1935544.1 acidic repeat containing [Pimephales promelas]
MDPGTVSLFQRVSEKLGWDRHGGLHEAEEKLRKSLGKSRRPALGSFNTAGSGKENHTPEEHLTSDDDDFHQFLAAKATPKSTLKQSASAARKPREPIPVLSSDSDDDFELFLNRVKTPQTKARPQSVSSGDDRLKRFIVDSLSSDEDFVSERKPSVNKGKASARTPNPVQRSEKRPPPRCDPPVFLSDSDEDGSAVITSTWRTRHTREDKPRVPVTPSAGDDTGSSEEEFQSLLERVRQNQGLAGRAQASPRTPAEPKPRAPCLSTPSAVGKRAGTGAPVTQSPLSRPVSRTEPRAPPSSRTLLCKTPGCFLQSLADPGSSFCRSFRQKREELTAKLFQLYNSSVFDSQLPADMSVTWNKKMRKTAGYCVSGQERGTGKRYARIELSDKVCDSADRLRDTLVHELCHAATWLINNVRDGHGPFWRLYARKAMLAHPELPMVTRCHSYDINYKYQYQCNRCNNSIGRHSKSLDTTKFVCALCTGQLVLVTPSKPRAPTPFASFVKENYSSARQQLAGQGHAEVMRKLSADFASKTRLSQS